MEREKLEGYLRKVEDLIFDEEKIVTYKYLSRVLDVHVNVAKQLLYEFLMKQQNINNCNISAIFLLAGSLKNGDNVVSIVNEDDLNEACIRFDKITSQHVYSILKGKEADVKKIQDMLYIVDAEVEPLKRCPVYYDSKIEEYDCEVKNVELRVSPNFGLNIKETSKAKKSIPKNDKKKTVLNFFNNFTQSKIPEKELKTENDQNGEGSDKISEFKFSQLNVDEEMNNKEKLPKKKEKKRKRIVSDSESSENDDDKEIAILCVENEYSGNLDDENGKEVKEDEDRKDKIGLIQTKKKRKRVVDKKITGQDGFIETIKEVMYETDSEDEFQQNNKEGNVKSGNNMNLASIQEQDGRRGKNRNLEKNAKGQQTLFSFFKRK